MHEKVATSGDTEAATFSLDAVLYKVRLKKLGDSNPQWDESTLALALVIQDYRPFITILPLLAWTAVLYSMNGRIISVNGYFHCANCYTVRDLKE